MTTRGPALALALLLVAAPALAQQPLEPDTGAVRPHRPAGPLNLFVSPMGEPFRAPREAPYAEADWFRRADADGDGRLTRAEFLADADRFFRTLDTDGDGVIDGFEIQAYESKVAPEISPRIGGLRGGEGQDTNLFHDRNGGVGRDRPARDGGGGRPGRLTASDVAFAGAGVFGVLNDPEPVTACDTDLDGRVTRAEWRAKAERRFALLDPSGAGSLTLAGLPKTYVQAERERAEKAARDHPVPPPR